MIQKLIRFFKKNPHERVKTIKNKIWSLAKLPFYFGKVSVSKFFLAYHPDAHTAHESYPEFPTLVKSFIQHNTLNNSGDLIRLWALTLNIKQVMSEDIAGDFAELGVWRGNTASVLAHYAVEYGRKLYLFDTFEGFDSRDFVGIDRDRIAGFADTSISLVSQVIGKGLASCEFVKGYFPDILSEIHKSKRYAIVSIDCDLYEPMLAGLEFFYPRMPQGGLLLLHDYASMSWPGATQAINEFCLATNERLIVMPDKSGSAFIRKAAKP